MSLLLDYLKSVDLDEFDSRARTRRDGTPGFARAVRDYCSAGCATGDTSAEALEHVLAEHCNHDDLVLIVADMVLELCDLVPAVLPDGRRMSLAFQHCEVDEEARIVFELASDAGVEYYQLRGAVYDGGFDFTQVPLVQVDPQVRITYDWIERSQ